MRDQELPWAAQATALALSRCGCSAETLAPLKRTRAARSAPTPPEARGLRGDEPLPRATLLVRKQEGDVAPADRAPTKAP
eukprot:7445163-Alexandrium_andersonii.AAC.1